MTDLSAALKAAGHEDLAAALERKALAGQLRQAGREDLAEALESDRQTAAAAGQPPALPATSTPALDGTQEQDVAAVKAALRQAGIGTNERLITDA